jgi:CP family cyanate transporter-like MFS transporter
MATPPPCSGRPLAQVLPALILLGLAGMASRIPILAVPPLLPLIHDDLNMSETQVGILVGLPLAVFAIAAVPGSLLVARLGARGTLVIGMLVAGIASAARGIAGGMLTLYLTTVVTGLGVAVMQPALPRLVREWLPERVGFGTAVYTNGILIGAVAPVGLTLSVVLPLVGNSWRTDLIVWAVPVVAVALIYLVAPAVERAEPVSGGAPARWWPDWNRPLTWVLGLTFASNNSIYFALNAVLPEYLTFTGRSDLISTSLLWLNAAQLFTIFSMLWLADRLLHRAWPYLVFGPLGLVGVLAIAYFDGIWVVFASAFIGVATAVTFATTLALPPALSRPDDVHRMAAGMFTIAYGFSVLAPVICGALWDYTGVARTAFLPIAICAIGLTFLGGAVSRYRPPHAAPLAAVAGKI